jgi:N-acetylglucosamine-6-sulfatase
VGAGASDRRAVTTYLQRRIPVAARVLVVALLCCGAVLARAPAAAHGAKNVIVFILDDARYDDLPYMKGVQRVLVNRGVTFSQFYSPFPLCCPARTTLLTGEYSHNTHVLSNAAPAGGFPKFDDSSTIATWLDPTHTTGLIGKYLNEYGPASNADRYVPPGWDIWEATLGLSTYNYTKVRMDINGAIRNFAHIYSPNLVGNMTQRFLDQYGTQPFFLISSFVAPHVGFPADPGDPPIPRTPYVDPRDRNTYVGPTVPQNPSFDEADVSDKPASVAALPPLSKEKIAGIRKSTAQRRESLFAVDRQIVRTVHHLAQLGELRNTYLILVSDNGYLQGEHRLFTGKRSPYQPAVHVPMVMRGPGLPARTTVRQLAGMQDLAPTILAMTGRTGAQQSASIDGRNLLPLARGRSERRPMLIEIARGGRWVVHGVITRAGWKYVEYPPTGEAELYNLRKDPYELTNLAGRPAYRAQQAALHRLLHAMQFCAGAACRHAPNQGTRPVRSVIP